MLALNVVVFLVFLGMGLWLGRKLSWRLFRWAYRNNPEALAFADREQGRSS